MKIVLLTGCSNRKTQSPESTLMGRNLPRASPAKLATEWTRRLRQSQNVRLPASEMYCGRGFREAEKCAQESGAGLFIISAGQGLVGHQEPICSYGMTVSTGHLDSVDCRGLPPGSFDSKDWWLRLNAALGRKLPISTLVRESPNTLFVLAISNQYFEMIQEDIDDLSERLGKRLRFVGPRLGLKHARNRWSAAVMAYDDRLDGPDSTCRGTRSDFPQRAARHFLRTLGPGFLNASALEHQATVQSTLAGWRQSIRVVRRRCTDAELTSIIDGMWRQTEGQVGRGLRILRDRRKVACEQSRFKRLFWQVAESRKQGHGNKKDQ